MIEGLRPPGKVVLGSIREEFNLDIEGLNTLISKLYPTMYHIDLLLLLIPSSVD